MFLESKSEFIGFGQLVGCSTLSFQGLSPLHTELVTTSKALESFEQEGMDILQENQRGA